MNKEQEKKIGLVKKMLRGIGRVLLTDSTAENKVKEYRPRLALHYKAMLANR